ncbi:hypothetical protein F3J23_07260 [Chryseobacterium sp. Tr-659]|uniref:hypothetical protein n=1 Tax=Chryseobacterium sp. Tr-659 TaxID=2608340 RepID=UPI001423041C|nr:hypothetical protein [Chryseobacterium sp. Tr-659]NIF05240.1 hypothetical protein [Chryseobacterium sp. Tr-659]
MIFENETLQHSGLNDKNNVLENQSLFPVIINSYGVTAFLIKSLEKIRKNATCEVMKNVIDTHIKEYILHIREFHMKNLVNITDMETKIEVEEPSFTLYAKTAYYKVVKEEEYINRFLMMLEKGNQE